jgi:hypothetical protein
MWRVSKTLRCVAHDFVTGVPSEYRPRYRPRRLVMPVDRWDKDNDKRQSNPQFADHLRRERLQREVRKRGALRLSSPPRERTAADAVRLALDTATAEGFASQDELLLADEGYKNVATALKHYAEALQNCRSSASSGGHNGDTATPNSSSSVAMGIDDGRSSEVSPRAYRIWELLEKTTMDSPAHGVLSLRGKANSLILRPSLVVAIPAPSVFLLARLRDDSMTWSSRSLA